MRSFKLDEQYSIVCEFENMRNGFRHKATLLKHRIDQGNSIARYSNRTWEAYEFETAMLKLVDEYFEGEEQTQYRKTVKNFK